jgi:hypothetical protein
LGKTPLRGLAHIIEDDVAFHAFALPILLTYCVKLTGPQDSVIFNAMES